MPEINDLHSGSSPQRDGLNHQSIEDYLKTIYMLALEESPVSTTRLAEARDVKPASATGMIRRLDKLNLVHYAKHHGVTLTPAGEKIALEVIRHHRLIELYLIEALGFTWDEVHEQADILEHVISEKLEERIARALGYPRFDPHGAPIPSKEGQVERLPWLPLTQLAAGRTARVSRIMDDENGALLRQLDRLGLRLGASVTAVRQGGPGATLRVRVDGVEQAVDYAAASSVMVEV